MDFKNKLDKFVRFCNFTSISNATDTIIFGAHIFTQYLIASGLDLDNVIGIFDNAVHKDGKRLYGTSLTVTNPEKHKLDKSVNIILAAGQYENEIIIQLKKILPSNSLIISKNYGLISI